MCIVIVKPAGQDLDFEEMLEAWDNNEDGGGFMFSEGGQLIVCKGYMKFRSFKKAYEKRDLKDRNVVVHFRISTSGKINQANCHPHMIYHDLAVAHNGIFTSKDIPIEDKAFSDTVHFCRMLKRLNDPDFLQNEEVRKWISSVSWASKLVFMDSAGEYEIINEADGDWIEGLWYSNLSHLYPTIYSSAAYQSWEWSKDAEGEWYRGPKAEVARCDHCGAVLWFDAEKQYDICEACLGQVWQGIAEEREDRLKETRTVITCQTCGERLIYDQELADMVCMECETAAVLRRESTPRVEAEGNKVAGLLL